MAALAEIRRLCLERYNITAPDSSSSLFVAIEAGSAGAIRAELSSREMYRWTEPIEDALSELESQGNASASEGFAALTVKELKAYAAEHEIDLGDAARKADIIAAIELAGEAETETPVELQSAAPGEALPPLPDSAYAPGAQPLPE